VVYSSLRKKATPTGIIYTMNVPESKLEEINYKKVLGTIESSIKRLFSGSDVESLYVTDTYQFDDYSKYKITMFDGELKAKRRKEEFPNDCRKAFEMGQRLIQSLA